ncbi:putative circularly permuted ATP-grasp superfamily protein [Flavobacterium sp. 103]|uniref:circularly permuted type 2 ATP-grasp protein n=1 Tax=Flavobacterium sp. 103 TaxID=2135624 RepID=UPI000D5E9D30|nr:circularly permuted type 2 ATP-grasp protein [Flavobacterium sp. 103]PVX46062.1 putative circularly permuted ATP-grasp superfamily protein [Flavobacterium sp. 103]
MMKLVPQLNPKGWDEMFSNEGVRDSYAQVLQTLQNLNPESLNDKQIQASDLFMNQGITFTVYSDNNQGIERIFPFDIIPRIITKAEWSEVETGIKQRLKALNLFLEDVYNGQHIVKDGIIPASLIASCPHYIQEVHGIKVPHNIHVHIAGIDLIRGAKGEFYVLEDNLRCPSGVSYMLENREITKRIFPDMLTSNKVSMVGNYPMIFHNILVSLSPRNVSNPNVVLLTPGVYNSAYYEHTFLARQMGIPLVEGRDLVVNNNKVYMKTTSGLQQVDVIYRRLDDEYLDPLVFKPESTLGVPGLISAYRHGNVALVNAVGNGVADDKAVYAYVPDMIKYYLNEEPILKNVPTYQMENREERELVFADMENMVIKETNGSGGYGMIMGNKATQEELENGKTAILANPRNFIAQPIIQLSTVPCLIDGQLKLRHVDLRPYALCGPNGVEIVPGGLTRVALTEGSLVVNSSQGGGSKDTWIIK